MSKGKAISSSYAVFSFQVDEAGAVSVPIGVALWSPEAAWVDFRLVREKERLKLFRSQEYLPFVRLAEDRLRAWMKSGSLPYAQAQLAPSTDAWWRHVRDLLVHRIRLSEPRPIDCRAPEDELEPLYEAVVAAHRPGAERRARVDGLITKCLDKLSHKFQTREPIMGFGGREVRVLRSYQGPRGCVVVEGVNLAGDDADDETDATVSRLLRLRAGLSQAPLTLIGYLAPPEGLNGEKPLVDWMRQKTNARVFDLMKEKPEFRSAAEEMVAKAEGAAF